MQSISSASPHEWTKFRFENQKQYTKIDPDRLYVMVRQNKAITKARKAFYVTITIGGNIARLLHWNEQERLDVSYNSKFVNYIRLEPSDNQLCNKLVKSKNSENLTFTFTADARYPVIESKSIPVSFNIQTGKILILDVMPVFRKNNDHLNLS